jgi:hypothetical protein
MSFVIAAALAALAQTAPAAETAAPAVAAPAADAAPAVGAESVAKFNLDTPIESLVADESAKAVLETDLPGLTAHPSYDMFKGMSLRQVQPLSNGQLTDEMMARTEASLAAIK